MSGVYRFGIASVVGMLMMMGAVAASAQTAVISPASLNYGTAQIGFITPSQSVTITNTGTVTLTFNSIKLAGTNPKDFSPLSHNCAGGVRAGASCTITAAFTPAANGTRSTSISLTDNAPDSPQSVPLTGVGGTPAVSLSPGSLSFASQNVGTTSAAQNVTLINTGTAPMGITSIVASGDYAQSNTCGTSLVNGASCSISVTFTPTVVGTRTGSISLTDTVTGSPQSVSLTGTGATPTAPAVSFSPSSLTFANQLILTSSATQSVTMTNTGTAFLSVNSLTLGGTNAGDFAPLSHTCSAGLAVGASCTISATFTPAAAGLRSATIVVMDNAADSPQNYSVSGTGITVASIAVTPTTASIAAGLKQQYTATATFSDGSTQNYTSTAAWTSSNGAVASVTSGGLASALTQGSSTITATASGVSGSAVLTVTAPTLSSIAVTPANASIAKGLTQQYTATGTYSDGSTQNITGAVTWVSAVPATASITTGGLVSTLAVGTSTIVATQGSISGSVVLTVTAPILVSMAVTPGTASFALGQNQQFTATGTYSDATTQNLTTAVAWTSSNPAVGVSAVGVATATATGASTITATQSGISGSASLTVNAAALVSIAVTPGSASIVGTATQQLTATGTYTDGTVQTLTATATWSSANPAAATVNAAGLVTGVAAGTSSITASATGVSGTVSGSSTITVTAPVQLQSVAITPTTASVVGIGTQQLTATGTYTDSSTQGITGTATWTSSNPAVATVNAAGLVTGVAGAAGTTTITASASGVGGTVSGTATITVTAATLNSIAVTPATASIPKGATQQFTATGTYSDGSTQVITNTVTWTSANLPSFTISATGLATGLTTGSGLVTAAQGSISGTAVLSVTQKALVSISTTPVNPTVAKGVTQQFTASGSYSDGSTQNISSGVTWTSSNTAVATVNATGSALTLMVGTTTITATQGTVSNGTTLTVTAAVLSSVSVTPTNPSVTVGGTQQFTATGIYSDGSTVNMTATATWTSSATKTATIVAGGLATSKAVGSTTITATSSSIKGTTTLTVAAAGTVTVTLSPRNASVTTSQTQQFTATVTGSSNTAVNWSVDGAAGGNAAAGTISASGLYTPPAVTGAHVVTATSQANTAVSASSNMYTTTFPGMFVYKNDLQRTGQNLNEPALNTTNVVTSTFGKLFSCAVDGAIYGQPLYYANLSIAGGIHNVIYVATMNNSAYAFDADSSSCQILWQKNFLLSNEVPVPITDISPSCGEIPQVNIGILGTPVIDTTSGKMYFITATKNTSGTASYHHRIYAVDVLTGNTLAGPTEIAASVAGTGEASVGGILTFDPKMHKARPALTLLNGVVYTGFGGECDTHPYHGWLFGFDANTLAMTNVMSTSADGEGNGVWMGGGGFSVDSNGNMFLVSGDGTFTGSTGGTGWGDSFLRLQPFNGSFNILDYFTPSNQSVLDNTNNDLGSSGLLLLPDQPGSFPHLAVSGGKDAVLHLVNRDQMGGYNAGFDNNLQDITLAQKLKMTPSYWNGNVYIGARTDFVRQYQVTVNSSGVPSLTQVQVSTAAPGYPGTAPTIVAASPTATSAVAFFLDNGTFANGAAKMYAVDATNVSKQLWVSTQAAGGRDAAHNAVKYTIPTVANGKVYIGTQGFVDVYGLLP